jgi:5,10-methylenetetrahydrofolate reductase
LARATPGHVVVLSETINREMSFADALNAQGMVIAAELRPPRAELGSREGMDAWIDTYHAVRSLARREVRVFLTDSAVGTQEENNLRHLVTNLGHDVSRDHVIPFLTSKHSLDFCLSYAEQAWQHGFPSLVVLGGDKAVGRQRCVAHAWQLRATIRAREPRLTLGGWANPYGDAAEQVGYMADECFTAEYFLTQIVSHLNVAPVERFITETDKRGIAKPGMFGVFYYRSANARTLAALGQFLPVPVEGLAREFAAGATPVDICARTMRAMIDVGARHFYISNLPLHTAASTLGEILDRIGVKA